MFKERENKLEEEKKRGREQQFVSKQVTAY